MNWDGALVLVWLVLLAIGAAAAVVFWTLRALGCC